MIASPLGALPPRRNLPATAQGLLWGARPYDFLRECARALGDSFTLDLGPSGTYVIFSRPDDIRTIFTADPAIVHAGKGNEILRPFLGDGSLLLLEEVRHQRERRLLMPAFHASRISEYGDIVREATLKTTASWRVGSDVVVQDAMQEISIDVILRAVFGVVGSMFDELRQELLLFLNDSKFNLTLMGQLRGDFDATEAWQEFRRRFERIDGLVRREIARRRSAGDGPVEGMLGLLLAATEQHGGERSDDELRDELLTLVVAGYETTATALAWSMYWIHTTPHVKAKILSTLSHPTPAENPYIDAVCKEVLRIHPVIPVVARQLQGPIEIGGFSLPAGVTVVACIYLAHHRGEAFPEPDVFRPERFLEATPPSPYEYLPFGGGARRCIGFGLAVYEIKVVLSTILSQFELEVVDPARVRPVRRSVTIAPSGGPRMFVTGQRQ